MITDRIFLDAARILANSIKYHADKNVEAAKLKADSLRNQHITVREIK